MCDRLMQKYPFLFGVVCDQCSLKTYETSILQIMKIVMKHHAAIVDNVINLERQFAFDDQDFCKVWRRYIGKA